MTPSPPFSAGWREGRPAAQAAAVASAMASSPSADGGVRGGALVMAILMRDDNKQLVTEKLYF
jgi:hypothetical protein